MRFTGKIQRHIKTLSQFWLNFREPGSIKQRVPLGQLGIADQIARITRHGDDKTALVEKTWINRPPDRERLPPQIAHEQGCRLRLAIGRQHGSRIAAGARRKRFRLIGSFHQMHTMSGACERQGLPQPHDPSTNDSHGKRRHGHKRSSLKSALWS